ncbi:MAG: DNA-3-methyladenine glycosylase [Myxococcota bacterium]
MPRLDEGFFARPCLEVARDLLGCLLIHHVPEAEPRIGRIVEAEAYLGEGKDAASHAHRGPTRRNRAMFGPPGRFYVYLSMGLHVCANVVCEAEGRGAAVLLRAVEPLEGLEGMRDARGGRDGVELTNGPGKLSQAFGITLDHYGCSALTGTLRIEPPRTHTPLPILRSARIGLSRATDKPYRFFVAENRYVSRSPLNQRARRIRAAGPGL